MWVHFLPSPEMQLLLGCVVLRGLCPVQKCSCLWFSALGEGLCTETWALRCLWYGNIYP